MSVSWKGDRELRQALEELIKRAPSLVASTLTGLAFEISAEVKRELPKQLNLTRNFLPNSVRYERATPQGLVATAGFDIRAGEIASRLEHGGVRRPKGRAIAIPTSEIRRSEKGGVSMGNRPKALLQRKNVFSGIPEGGRVAGIWRKSKKQPLKLLYLYKPSTTYRAGQIHFFKTAERVMREKGQRKFEDAIQRLLSRSATR